MTSGRTVINCVRALRAAGIRCDQVATIYAADDHAMRARFIAEPDRMRRAGLDSEILAYANRAIRALGS